MWAGPRHSEAAVGRTCFLTKSGSGGALSPYYQGLGTPNPFPVPLLGAELQVTSAPQKDLANVDYEDLFLYTNALAEEAASSTHGPSEHRNPSSQLVAAPKEVCDKELSPPTWGRDRGRGGL